MGTVKLAAALPKEPELNGLMDHVADLLRKPADEYLIVARVGVSLIEDRRWEGTRVPVLGVVAAELVTDDEEVARQLLDRAKDRRYARARLPWPPGTLGNRSGGDDSISGD